MPPCASPAPADRTYYLPGTPRRGRGGGRGLRGPTKRQTWRHSRAVRSIGGLVARDGRSGPVAELRRWQDRAACQDADPELFFYPDGERGLDREQRDDAHLNLPRVAHRICPLW